ncbi:putative S-adenosylmethionine-dependent methyltransferase/MSMEI_2290 [Paraliobacillus sp. PM-2]|uniref:class I SAM-dependent methyltransferase n=1 Tax=Paraliobacillus sp. PM-2 TaxID=1462524 RepID=UPI00061C5E47|nr:methyltransferase domain-containing protein [Paraliobacillus sp. PM-2]CQR46820.1 putative S-adenosylmethionine-dependent methyltransferase/MSMEI_2290 [Paraliobacillus sp. PM-2]
MLKDTGERVIPNQMNITNELLLEHLARYHFSIPYVQGRVLDFATGTGYGAHVIAKKCKNKLTEIVGIDIDPEVIKYARGNYYHPLSNYLIENVTNSNLSEKLGQFDVILSFETIEHVKDEQQFLANAYQLLKEDGILILSTPFGKGRGKPCGSPFHVHQLTPDEFYNLFSNYSNTQFYYQKGPLIEPVETSQQNYYPLGLVVAKK